jgi:CheY-like chemotaxis protein
MIHQHPVCIVDDDQDILEILGYALESDGVSTICFDSPKKAESYLSQLGAHELPCLMIVDFMMPEMDGITFIEKMRENYPEKLSHIPIALSTARLFHEGEYCPPNLILLEKPWDFEKLMDTVKHYYFSVNSQFSSL